MQEVAEKAEVQAQQAADVVEKVVGDAAESISNSFGNSIQKVL